MLLENIVSWKLNIIINYFLVMKKNYNYNIYQNNYYIFERIINNLSEEQKKKMGFTNFFLYLEEIEIAELIYNLLVYYEDHTKKLISSSGLDHSKFEIFFQRLNEIKAAMDITYNVSQKCVNIYKFYNIILLILRRIKKLILEREY